jgi:hypothetical protein
MGTKQCRETLRRSSTSNSIYPIVPLKILQVPEPGDIMPMQAMFVVPSGMAVGVSVVQFAFIT